MNSIADLRQTIQLSQQDTDPYAWYVMQRFSIYVTLALAHLSVTPNQVTVLAMLCGVIGGVIWGFLDQIGFIVGGLFLQLMFLLDCVDGELARYRGLVSQRGAFLDLIGHYFVNFCMMIGAGIGLSRMYDERVYVISLLAILFSFADELQRNVLLKVSVKANAELREVYERFTLFKGERRSSPLYQLMSFVGGIAGLITCMPVAALVDYLLAGDWVKLTVFAGWTLVIIVKFSFRFHRIYTGI